MKGAVGAVGAGGLEQVEGAVGVDAEVGLRVARGPVVGGLGGGVDDQLDLAGVLAEDPLDRRRASRMSAFSQRNSECSATSRSVTCEVEDSGPKKLRPHVVLDADDVEALADEVLDRLGADQPPGPSDDRNRHSRLLPSPRGGVDVERLGDPLLVRRHPLVDVGEHLLGAAPRSPLVQAEESCCSRKGISGRPRPGSARPARSAPRCRSARGRSPSSPAARGCTRGRRRR